MRFHDESSLSRPAVSAAGTQLFRARSAIDSCRAERASCRPLLSIALCAAVLAGCAGLPSREGLASSAALTDTSETQLGKAAEPLEQDHPGQSGLLRLANGRDAFAARLRLAEIAERSLDVQYYIWQNDLTGTLLLDSLRRAADRGVRVRILLDDSGTRDLDSVIASLVVHPNIEVRLFNPFAARKWRAFESVFEFARLNRRMHNKSFTADNQVTLIGGRNVGDAYFGAGPDPLFVDLDVLAIGPVVRDVSRDFDRYWSSQSAYPAERLVAAASATSLAAVTVAADRIEHSAEAASYVDAVAQQPLVRKMLERDITFEWAPTRLVSDNPDKADGEASEDTFMWPQLKRLMKPTTHELDLVSAYFVPGSTGVDYLSALARSGAKVSVLTNSLEATDVPAVHSGYAKWRKSLLTAGVSLWEIKRSPPAASAPATRFGSSSGSSLHAKVFESDRAQVFIGSFNFDPRSRYLNTELGFVIDSPPMAQDIARTMAERVPELAYQLRLGADGSIQWLEQLQGEQLVHDAEPGTTFWKRAAVGLMSMLPIEWLL
jgi:putative cardiolipin synthase